MDSASGAGVRDLRALRTAHAVDHGAASLADGAEDQQEADGTAQHGGFGLRQGRSAGNRAGTRRRPDLLTSEAAAAARPG